MAHVKLISRYSLLLGFYFLILTNTMGEDTFARQVCSVNDDCQSAILIPNVISDQSFACMAGCNLDAAPDPIVSNCQMGDFPTVWYAVATDTNATILNIEVHSPDFESPVISVFKGSAGCDFLEQVYLTNGNLSCIIGSQGVAKAVGTAIQGAEMYYIAVSSLISIGGDFEICVSTISKGSYCVLSRDLQIIARSNGGHLEGPFDPGEKIRVCMNVNEYTAFGNGCQWFQGIVPVFGNGWDFSSFNAEGQPTNATMNDISIDTEFNGIYGASTWGWFNDVGYHHDNSRYKIGDFDGNGRIEMCNGSYEIDCPNQTGITGGCCGPCWENQGTLLPGGWFAHGINGTCPLPGPPISVDWGDGNTCGGGMGPWSFCFDLFTRSSPDCLEDTSKRDLTLGFYTFSDGEIGAWAGGQSVCANDQPVKLSFKAQCGRVTRITPEVLPDLCKGSVFTYQIEEPGISHWEWNISPAWAVPVAVNTGENGFIIESPVYGHENTTQEVTGILIGHVTGSQDVVIRKFHFNIQPCGIYSDVPLYVGNEKPPGLAIPKEGEFTNGQVEMRSIVIPDEQKIRVYPVPSGDKVFIDWSEEIVHPKQLMVYDTRGSLIRQVIIDPEGSTRKELDISILDPGVYFINVFTQDKSYVAKLIKI